MNIDSESDDEDDKLIRKSLLQAIQKDSLPRRSVGITKDTMLEGISSKFMDLIIFS
jgi:hypothetical protein